MQYLYKIFMYSTATRNATGTEVINLGGRKRFNIIFFGIKNSGISYSFIFKLDVKSWATGKLLMP